MKPQQASVERAELLEIADIDHTKVTNAVTLCVHAQPFPYVYVFPCLRHGRRPQASCFCDLSSLL